MAGHKGYAISFMMDVLSGVLMAAPSTPASAAACRHERAAAAATWCWPPRRRRRHLGAFEERTEALIAEIKAIPLAEGAEENFYPGEIEDRAEALA